jgi:hypothetical protein
MPNLFLIRGIGECPRSACLHSTAWEGFGRNLMATAATDPSLRPTVLISPKHANAVG